MPFRSGSAANSILQASRPPAEAPIATTGKFARPLTASGALIHRGRSGVAERGLPDILFVSQNASPAEETLKALPQRLYDSDHFSSIRAIEPSTSVRE
jgi:hypothetical protein